MDHFLVTWGYLALFGTCLVSALGIPIGSEVITAYAGALASGQLTGTHDHLLLPLVIVVAVLGELVGSTAGYLVGRFGGRPLVDRLGKFVLLTHRDLDRAEAWFARRGEPFVLVGRCIPLLRSFVSLAAGLGEMAYGRFIGFSVVGTTIFCGALAGIGYSLGSSWHHVLKDFSDAGYVFGALFVLLVIVVFLHRVRVVRSERDEGRALHGRRLVEPAPQQTTERPSPPRRTTPPRRTIVAPRPVVPQRPPGAQPRAVRAPEPPVPPRPPASRGERGDLPA